MTKTTPTITYPTAHDLDTVGRACRVSVYLDPEHRTVYAHEGDGLPEGVRRGHHVLMCGVPRDADGASVLTALRACDAEISALADCYVGGRWVDGWWERLTPMDRALERALLPASEGGYLRTAQDALDWLATVHMTWAELCEAAGVDPERRDDDAVRAVVKRVESVAWVCGAILVNTERAVRRYLDHADG